MPDPTPTTPTDAAPAAPAPATTAPSSSVLGSAAAPAIPPAPPPAPTLTEALFPEGADNPAGHPPTAAASPSPPEDPAAVTSSDEVTPPPAEDPAKPDVEAKPPAEATILTAESYQDLTLPEGLVVDDTLFASAKSAFAEAGVDPAKAPALLALYKSALEAQVATAQAQTQAVLTEWETARNAMPEFQGDRKARTEAVLGQAIEEFGDQSVRDILNVTKLGDHPGLVKMILSMASALVEDGPMGPGSEIPSGANGQASLRNRSLGQLLYPDGGGNPNGSAPAN